MKRLGMLAFAVFVLGGCDRTHLSAHYGEPNRNAFRAQVIHPNAGNETKAEQPLDPEESAMVAGTYIRSLGPANTQDQSNAGSRILVVPATPPGGVAPPPLEMR
jgi:hypothetical protein